MRINGIPFYSTSTRKNNKKKSSLVYYTHQNIFPITFLALKQRTHWPALFIQGSSNKERERRHQGIQQRETAKPNSLAWKIAGQAAFNKSIFWLVGVTLSKGHILFISARRSVWGGQQKNPARVTNVLVAVAGCPGNHGIFQECLPITKPKLVRNIWRFLIVQAHLICK